MKSPSIPQAGGYFGPLLEPNGTLFRFWAPDCRDVALCLEGPGVRGEWALARDADGWCEQFVEGAGAGTRYRFRIDGNLLVPDPASRFQPDDIHGASEVINPAGYAWRTPDWRGRPWREAVIYELHVGTFTPEGTFRALESRLDALVDLGVTAIELMPVADFPGKRDWGYNGVHVFAPDCQYGRPEDLKALVDAAHERGLMMLLDVVYNHFGPEGNYLHCHAKRFFDASRHTPWGAAIDFEGKDSRWVRAFFIENAIHWLTEFRFDGLRFDAVHAIEDHSACHILEELAGCVYAAVGDERAVHLVLENDRNEARFLTPRADRATAAYVAQWDDDIHHAFHVLLTGEADGYYADYADDPGRHLVRCLTEGFAWQGDVSPFRGGEIRGEASGHLPMTAFVDFVQNHDQVGNRAFGDRLCHLAPVEALRAAAAVLLMAPSPPLLFMGEEWAADQPFLFFCDLGEDLRDSVREGRRREFAEFFAAHDPAALQRIPDPTSEETFFASKPDWRARDSGQHAEMLDHYRRLLALRHREIVPRLKHMPAGASRVVWREGPAFDVTWRMGDACTLHLRANLSDRPHSAPPLASQERELFAVNAPNAAGDQMAPWSVVWSLV